MRLKGLKGRFNKQEQLLERYDCIMKDHLKKGYIELADESTPSQAGRTWYVPHHPVFNPKKPGKLRIVFDCAAKYDGIALNNSVRTRYYRQPRGAAAEIQRESDRINGRHRENVPPSQAAFGRSRCVEVLMVD